jgi:hypothetical protein
LGRTSKPFPGIWTWVQCPGSFRNRQWILYQRY